MSVISADDIKKAYAKANENSYVSKGEVVLALLEKGQHSTRYKLGDSWELNLFEIQEAIDNMESEDVIATIHDLEERLTVELDHSHCLEIELAQIKALKPVNISSEDYMVQGYLTKEKYYTCPKCNKVLGNARLVDIIAMGREYRYCNRCGQGLDWSEATK